MQHMRFNKEENCKKTKTHDWRSQHRNSDVEIKSGFFSNLSIYHVLFPGLAVWLAVNMFMPKSTLLHTVNTWHRERLTRFCCWDLIPRHQANKTPSAATEPGVAWWDGGVKGGRYPPNPTPLTPTPFHLHHPPPAASRDVRKSQVLMWHVRCWRSRSLGPFSKK